MECVICFNSLTEEGDITALQGIPSSKRPRMGRNANATFCVSSQANASASGGPTLNGPNCGHIYHRVCILGWFEKGKKHCPVCSKPFTKAQLKPVFLPTLDERCKKCERLEEQVKKMEVASLKDKQDYQEVIRKNAEGKTEMDKKLEDIKKALEGEVKLRELNAVQNKEQSLEIKKYTDENSKLKDVLQQNGEKIDEFRLEIARLQQLNGGLFEELETLKEDSKKIQDENQDLKKKLDSSEQENLKWRKENQELNGKMQAMLKQEVDPSKDDPEILNARLFEVSESNKRQKELIDFLKKEKNEIMQKTNEEKRLLNDRIEKILAENKTLNEKVAEFNVEKGKWDDERNALKNERKDEALQREIENLKGQLNGALAKEKELRQKIKTCEKRINEIINKNMDLQLNVVAEREKTEEEARKLRDLQERLELLSNDLEEARARHARERERADILEAQIASLK